MATPPLVYRADHRHVTERESAHRWPNGQWDDSSWEDCTFMSGVELARLCRSKSIPATHYEGERLRQASGNGPSGGTNMDDLRDGLSRRYGWNTVARPISGFSALWNTLTPGKAAACQGRMGAFPYGHRLRRWQKGFAGKHCVLIVRADSLRRVWWCDPLAPEGSYQGEWVTKDELKRYVDSLTAGGGRHLVTTVRHNYVVSVKDKARLYVRKDLVPTAKDVIISPGPRTMPWKGMVTSTSARVEYVNAKGVHTGVLYYVKTSAVYNVRAL